jgi:hypothetical protein
MSATVSTTERAATGEVSLALLTPGEALADADLRREWEALLDHVHHLHRFMSSPAYFEHRRRINPEGDLRLAVLRRRDGRVAGICPIDCWRNALPFEVGKWSLGRLPLRSAVISGGEPLLPPDPVLFRRLFDGLLDGLPWCDCLHVHSLPCQSYTHTFLYGEGRHSRNYYIYPREPEQRPWHVLELGASIDHFLKGKLKRTRNTLKRRVRKLREHAGGALECARIDTLDQVDAFYEAAVHIAEQSWQFHNLARRPGHTALTRENLRDLARMGALRAYLLRCAAEPIAYLIAFQHEDVLLFEETAYAERLGRFSPGTVLYFLLLQDFYEHNPPAFIDHGTGEGPHKLIFSNALLHDLPVYLFRRSIGNRLGTAAHGSFQATVRLAKRFLKPQRAGLVNGEVEDGEGAG